MVTFGDLRGDWSATCLNLENSCVAFDMLMATKPMVPLSSGCPAALSGRMRASCASAVLRCASGGVFCPAP
jgi:hypothetical protein